MTASGAHRLVSRVTAALAALLLASAFAVADTGRASAVDTYSISGQVTLPDGAPLEYLKGVTVYANKETGALHNATVKPSEVDGTYTVSGLPAGTYKVIFLIVPYSNGVTVQRPDLVEETYDGSYTAGTYTPIDLNAGNATGIDATLEWGATISGTVSMAADAPSAWLGGVSVAADGPGGVHITALADATTGAYSLTNLPAGTYLVYFANWMYNNGGTYAWTEFHQEYYDDVYSGDDATPITATYNGDVTGIDAELSGLGHFTSSPAPTITALSLKEGATLGSSTGAWSPAPTFAFRWKRDGAPIYGATKAHYTITAADIGKNLTLTVTASRDDFTTVSKTSATKYIPKVFTRTVTPTISGTARAGYWLTANRGTWSPTPAYSYQWYRGGVKIANATSYRYKLTSADKGRTITVKVTGKKTGYTTVTKTSAGKRVAS